MKLEENKVYQMKWEDGAYKLPAKSANLIIADPPYFEVKGDFDFIWKTFEDYLIDVEKWAKACKYVLADNGTLFWWGMDRKIAYSQIILDKYFKLIGTPVWEKPSSPNEWDTRRTFPERAAERLLIYSNEIGRTGLEIIMEDYIWQRNPFGIEIKKARTLSGLKRRLFAESIKENYKNIDSAMAQISNWELGKNIPVVRDWEIIRKVLPISKEYEELRKEYEGLRKEYEGLRRPFDNYLSLTDVFRFPREINQKHPTQKSKKLTRALILTCSKKSDLVVVPFAGSGTECAMSAKERRRFIGFDIEDKYCKMANKRANEFLVNRQISILDYIE